MDAAVNNNNGSASHKQQQQHHTPSNSLPPPHPSTLQSSSNGDFIKEPAEYYAKYRVYERDFLRRINHKYFAGKKSAGAGRVFESITTLDGFTIKESSEAPIKRFLDHPSSREEQHSQSGGPLPPAKKLPSSRRKS